MENLTTLPAWLLAFIFSATFHEAAHAWAGFKMGDRTAWASGQVSLDPLPHIRREPFGMIVMPLISFFLWGWMVGWASAPYDRTWADRYPRRALMMALAGPTANLVLVILAGIAIRAGMLAGWFVAPNSISGAESITVAVSEGLPNALAMVLSILFTLNLVLFIFNLIPFPPLDGSSILPFLLPAGMAAKYKELLHNRGFVIIGLIVAWNLFGYVFGPARLLALNLLYFEHGYH